MNWSTVSSYFLLYCQQNNMNFFPDHINDDFAMQNPSQNRINNQSSKQIPLIKSENLYQNQSEEQITIRRKKRNYRKSTKKDPNYLPRKQKQDRNFNTKATRKLFAELIKKQIPQQLKEENQIQIENQKFKQVLQLIKENYNDYFRKDFVEDLWIGNLKQVGNCGPEFKNEFSKLIILLTEQFFQKDVIEEKLYIELLQKFKKFKEQIEKNQK